MNTVFSLVYFVGGLGTPSLTSTHPERLRSIGKWLTVFFVFLLLYFLFSFSFHCCIFSFSFSFHYCIFCFLFVFVSKKAVLSYISVFLNNGKPITNVPIVSSANICYRTISKLTSKNFKFFFLIK